MLPFLGYIGQLYKPLAALANFSQGGLGLAFHHPGGAFPCSLQTLSLFRELIQNRKRMSVFGLFFSSLLG